MGVPRRTTRSFTECSCSCDLELSIVGLRGEAEYIGMARSRDRDGRLWVWGCVFLFRRLTDAFRILYGSWSPDAKI